MTDEFPGPDELPAHPLSPEDLSPFSVDADDFDTIDELATAEWRASTTATERIQQVLSHATTPLTAKELAESAAVSPTKTQNVLDVLLEQNSVVAHQTNSTTRYSI